MLLLLWGCAQDEFCPKGSTCLLAGTGKAGFNGDHLGAADTQLSWPASVQFDHQGYLTLVDFDNMLVRRFSDSPPTPESLLETVAGSGAHAWSVPGTYILESPLENPVDAAWQSDGSFFIAALHEQRILRVGLDHVVNPYAGTGENGFGGDDGLANQALMTEPGGIALAPDGRLFIADTRNHCIRMVGTDDIIHTLTLHGDAGYSGDGGSATKAQFNTPERILWNDNKLYISDTYNHVIRRIDLDNGMIDTIAGTGIAGESGDGGPATEAQLQTPYGLDMDEEGMLYIADSGNNRIRRIDQNGTIETLTGTGDEGFVDGPADHAQYAWPIDITIEGDHLYIADMRNSAIRLFRLP